MLKNPPRLSFRGAAGDEESRPDPIGVPRGRFLAEFTLSGQSEILRCAQDDSEGLGMIRQLTDSQRFFRILLGKRAENTKKMLFGGNEPKNTLKTQHLTFSGTQNELLFEFRNPRSNPKIGLKIRFQVSGGSISTQEPRFRAEEKEFENVHAAQQWQQTPLFRLDKMSLPTGEEKT
jgi:hypothetical protein